MTHLLRCPRPLIVASMVLVATTVSGAPPRAVVNGPLTATAGELVSLDAGESSEPEHFLWKVTPELLGRKLFEVCDGGRRIRIATLPGTYTYALAVANKDGIDLVYHTITIPGSVPVIPPGPTPPHGPVPKPPDTPTPGPGPSPTPPAPVPSPSPVEPQFPTGRFNLSADVYRWAMSKVVSPNRAAEAKSFADAGEALAAELAAGKISGFTRYDLGANVQRAISEKLLKLPTEVIDRWRPFVGDFNLRVNDLFKAGRLTTTDHWADLSREFSTGLRAVK